MNEKSYTPWTAGLGICSRGLKLCLALLWQEHSCPCHGSAQGFRNYTSGAGAGEALLLGPETSRDKRAGDLSAPPQPWLHAQSTASRSPVKACRDTGAAQATVTGSLSATQRSHCSFQHGFVTAAWLLASAFLFHGIQAHRSLLPEPAAALGLELPPLSLAL